jgi:hypothetical protein
MDTLQLQEEKLTLIHWISQIQDVSLITKLRYIQKSNSEEIPQWQQDFVLERMKDSRPEDYISWEEAEKQL